MVGGDDRDRLALVADLADGEHRLVGVLQAVGFAPGTSSAVSTAYTPGVASAAVRSMPTIRARGCGLRSVAPHSIPSVHRSEENANSPVTLSVPSGRSGDVPIADAVPPRAHRAPGVRAALGPTGAARRSRRRCSSPLPAACGRPVRATRAPLRRPWSAVRRPRTTARPPTSSSCQRRGRARRPARRPGRRCRRGRARRARHSAMSASLPGSSEPISSSRPEAAGAADGAQRAAPRRAVSAAGPPRSRASAAAPGAARRPACPPRWRRRRRRRGRPATPASSRSRTGAMPAPSRALEVGQCATPVPVRAELRDRARRRGARRGRARRRRRASRAARRTRPACSRSVLRQNSSSSSVSARWVCSRTPRRRASAAASRISSLGHRERRARRDRDPQHRARRRVVVAVDRRPAVAARAASVSSTTLSGGSPPCDSAEVHRPAAGWNRRPIRRGRLDLRGEQVAAVAREDVVVVGGGRAAGQREPAEARRAAAPRTTSASMRGPDRVQRGQPAEQGRRPGPARGSPTGRGGGGC